MTRIMKIVLCLVFVLSYVGEVFSLKCWVCDSKIDPNCGSPFDSSAMTLTDCSTQSTPGRIPNYCYTQKKRVNGIPSYTRGCGFTKNLTVDLPCVSQPGFTNQGERLFLQYCPCNDKDGCNNGDW